MRALLTSVFVAMIIAGGAMLVLDQSWQQADQAFTSPTSVRIPKSWRYPQSRREDLVLGQGSLTPAGRAKA